MNVPELAAPQESRPRRGSMPLGFVLAWVVMIVGYAAIVTGWDVLLGPEGSALTLMAMPWVASILLIIWLIAKGRSRTAGGVAIGLATFGAIGIVLFVLLVQQLSHNFR